MLPAVYECPLLQELMEKGSGTCKNLKEMEEDIVAAISASVV